METISASAAFKFLTNETLANIIVDTEENSGYNESDETNEVAKDALVQRIGYVKALSLICEITNGRK